MAECPKKKLLNALLAEDSDPNQEEPSSSRNGGEDQSEDEHDAMGALSFWCNALDLFSNFK